MLNITRLLCRLLDRRWRPRSSEMSREALFGLGFRMPVFQAIVQPPDLNWVFLQVSFPSSPLGRHDVGLNKTDSSKAQQPCAFMFHSLHRFMCPALDSVYFVDGFGFVSSEMLVQPDSVIWNRLNIKKTHFDLQSKTNDFSNCRSVLGVYLQNFC